MTNTNNARYFAALEKSAALRRAQSFIILKDGQHAGTVKFALPADGAGKLTAFTEDFTTEDITRRVGTASGCGYDKRSAAMSGHTFCGVTLRDSGENWQRQLEAAGLVVIQTL